MIASDDLLPTRFARRAAERSEGPARLLLISVRVTEGRRTRIKVSKDDGRLIWGFEVDRHGVVDRARRRFFACARQDVIRELRMRRHDGELVPLE